MEPTEPKKAANGAKFRLQSRSFFLTFPQCPASREQLAEALASKGKIEQGVIGQEAHASGDLHLHAYVKYDTKLHIRDPHYFDFLGYHGKYEPARNGFASVKYVTKHDKSPLELGDMKVEDYLKQRADHKKVLGKRLAEGESLVSLIESGEHQLIFDYAKITANIKAYFEDKARAKPDCIDLIPNNWDILLPIHSDKDRHYWFWSDQPNTGKTTFLKQIADTYRASWYSR
jgi:hypothetical protein